MTPTTMTTGYVRSMEPFTVEIPGVDAVAQPCQRNAYAEVGMRGRVDVVGGTRSWAGEWDTNGVPVEVRTEIAVLGDQLSGMVESTNEVVETANRFEQAYSLDRAETAVELGDIRDQVAGVVLTALTTTRLAVISQDAGLYIDPTFSDAAISAERATNTGMTYTPGTGLSGTSVSVFLTGQGVDEGVTIPLIPQDRYTARVWGTGLTAANGRVLAIKHSNGVVTDLPTVYGTGYMAATAVPTSAGARLLVRRISGTGSATITRVEVRHGLGGTLIDDNSIDADKINVDKAVIGLKLTSPDIETNPAASRGIKIINDTLTGYSSSGEKLIEIGGPSGIIKGVTLEGATVTGGKYQTAPAGVNRVLIDALTGLGPRITLRSSYLDRPVVQLLADDAELGGGNASLKMFHPNNTWPLLTLDTLSGLTIITSAGSGQVAGTFGQTGFGVGVTSGQEVTIDAPVVKVNGVSIDKAEQTNLRAGLDIRRAGATRELIINITSGTFPVGATDLFSGPGVIPAADRPATQPRYGRVSFGGTILGDAAIDPNGTVTIINQSGASRSIARGNVTWTV